MRNFKERIYLDSISQVDRILSNMDRNRDSQTYGCLCRPFWHDKAMDFPSTHQQIGVLPLSIVYGNELENNPYYRKKEIQEWCKAGINYWKKVQKKNGSFDEHYPREHSLGASAWTLWAVTESIKHLEDPPEINNSVQKTVDFLGRNDEPGNITNHQAVAVAALHNSKDFANVPSKLIQEKIHSIKERQSEEGWFLEYRGGDPGYQSTTLAHLARIWEKEPGLIDGKMIEKALDFFSNFIDDQNYYGSRLGSRNTQHIHPTGFEVFSEDFNLAEKIALYLRKHNANGKILSPAKVDDKHFSWHLAENLDSYLKAEKIAESNRIKNIQDRDMKDFLIRNKEDTKIFINISKGGHMKYYKNNELIKERTGGASKIGKKYYTANWMDTTEDYEIKENKLKISGKMRKVPENQLNWGKHTALRLFQHSIGRFPRISLFMKDKLIDRLITGGKSSHRFEREINLENGNTRDELEGEKLEGKTRSMFIPNSEYYENSS